MKNLIKAVIAVVVLAGIAGAAETKWNLDVFGGKKAVSAPTYESGTWRLLNGSNVWTGDGMPVVETDGSGNYKIDGVAVETGQMELSTAIGKTRLCGGDSMTMFEKWGYGYVNRRKVYVKKLAYGYQLQNAAGEYLDMFVYYKDGYKVCVLKCDPDNASDDSYKMLARAASLMLTYFFGTGTASYTAD